VITYFAVAAGAGHSRRARPGADQPGRPGAMRPLTRSRSAGASRPQPAPAGRRVDRRRPGTESSTTGSIRLRWPGGLMPPTTYPVARSASAGSASPPSSPRRSCRRLEVPGCRSPGPRRCQPPSTDQRLEHLVLRQAEPSHFTAGDGARRVLVGMQGELDTRLGQRHGRRGSATVPDPTTCSAPGRAPATAGPFVDSST
jgi:hypothetical protein